MLLIGDLGSVIYLLGFAGLVLVLLLSGSWRLRWGFALAAVFLIAPWILSTTVGGSIPGARQFLYPRLPETAFYRLITMTGAEQDLLLQEGETIEDLNIDRLLRNSHQFWQMFSYVAHGSLKPAGYGRVPLTSLGMTYPTTLGDCAYASYITSEDGRYAAVLLVILLTAIAAALLWGAMHLPGYSDHRFLPLLAIGLFFAANSSYMAGANVGLLPFTGQNIPLFSFHSVSDVIQGGLLLVVAVLLLTWNVRGYSERAQIRERPELIAACGLLAAILLWSGSIFRQHGRLAAAGTGDFNFPPKVLDAMENNLPQAGKNVSWKFNSRTLELVPENAGRLSAVELEFGRQFNRRPDKENPGGGLYYLQANTARDGAVRYRPRVSRNYGRLRSPFAPERMWSGDIRASGGDEGEQAVATLGGWFRVGLVSIGETATAALSEPPPPLSVKAVVVKDHAGGVGLFEIFREGPDISIEKKDPHTTIYVEGAK
jgi:hypothetical protein